MHVSKRRSFALAAAGAVLVSPVVAAAHGRTAPPSTLHLVETGGGLRLVDNPPKARHPYDFSAGDIVVVSRDVLRPDGGRAGSLRLVCVATSPTTQQCIGTEALAGGTIELAGVSAPAPSTTVAVVGGTGLYAGARGTSVSSDRKGNRDVADQTISLRG